VTHLKDQGYEVWATDLSEGAVPMDNVDWTKKIAGTKIVKFCMCIIIILRTILAGGETTLNLIMGCSRVWK